jgi:hypothetical protein
MTVPNTNQNPNPDPQNPNPPSDPNLETPIPDTPPAAIETIPRTEFDRTLQNTHQLYGEALREAEGKRKQLERDIEDLRRTASQPSVPDDQLSPAELISREVGKQVKPLVDQFTQFRLSQSGNEYQNIKNQFRSMPAFAPFFSQLEPYIDQEMQGKEINTQNVQNAIAVVIGRFQMQAALNPQTVQQIPQTQLPQGNQPVNNPPANNPALPAHLRSSAPPLPNRQPNNNLTPNGNVRRQLSELEKRVAREQRPPLSDDQYIDWISETNENVIHSKIGIPQGGQ